mmetsp:Transcript_34885/g.81567  ORF Transcript_34885/g.81567 Transcript_34885/m.81567 type:complete len:366 (-) Transcript_34885:44-1141(-)
MADELLDRLPFMRITLIGAGGSGKTALANAFINGVMPQRYIKTDKQVVYHTKAIVTEETAQSDRQRPLFVEIEDTPGSEKGPDDIDGPSNDTDMVPKVKKGARVTVESNEQKAKAMFKDPKYKGKITWRDEMKSMLGRDYTVKEKKKNGAVGLPSVDGSEGGVWLWPGEAVKLKVSLDLPIDRFFNTMPNVTKSEAKSQPRSQKDKEQELNDLNQPFSAFKRKWEGAEIDRTFTRNRMGFFIIFDMSDENGDSLREAITLYDMLQRAVTKHAHGEALKPITFVVGTKADRTNEYRAMDRNRRSAAEFSQSKMIQFHEVSARTMKGVKNVFHEMLLQILVKEPLWAYQKTEDEEELAGAEGGCIPF